MDFREVHAGDCEESSFNHTRKIPTINMKYLTLLLKRAGGFRPPTKKWQLLLKIMILKSPNFVT